ncbi:MAG: ABC transporter ATP-binding protein [Clostridia bacterium]|nr:ABC transporter ATP-binding protein [Clostridia bacterium]
MANNILEVKNLKISFRTNSGTVKAVRNISFNLQKGETLAIVGESGSGKSVTSKAILGILAGNSIVEGGEILYDGRDLLKITEEEMCKIRGDKISMIFQDPLSSLDPIVKIGKQITEAMLLKNKTNRKRARAEFNTTLRYLKEAMLASAARTDKSEDQIAEMIKTFDDFNILAIRLENSYNAARAYAEELKAQLENFLYMAEKKQKLDVKRDLGEYIQTLGRVKDDFLTAGYDAQLASTIATLERCRSGYKAPIGKDGKPQTYVLSAELTEALKDLVENLLTEILERPQPNFFRIGYYVYKNPNVVLDKRDINALNEMAVKYLDETYMAEFIKYETMAIRYSAEKSLECKKKVLDELAKARDYFLNTPRIEKGATKEVVAALCKVVESSIDRLEYNKDNIAYTFSSSLKTAANKYFTYEKLNPKEERRYARQSAKREALIARGKKIDWKVVPKNVYDLEDLRDDCVSVIDRLERKYKADIENFESRDFDKNAVGLIDYLKAHASEVVYKITKRMAKEKAIKLMEEVGIPEPRTRYNQYPFEFSGGMRQRIVIAIALVANPDILICDEPTTALDVTIQSQILELINKIKKERQLSIIFITHDLGVVANMADRIGVMYAGKIVEYGTSEDIFYSPAHPYTWALLSSMPDLDTNEKLEAIPGTPPNMIYPPVGDAFAERNKYALKVDFEVQPPMFKISETHSAATWLLHPDAPKVDMPKIIKERIARMNEKGGNEDV